MILIIFTVTAFKLELKDQMQLSLWSVEMFVNLELNF